MKRLLTITLCCLLALTACSSTAPAPSTPSTQEPPAQETPTEEVPAKGAPTEEAPEPAQPEEAPEEPVPEEDPAARLAAYTEALETLLNEHRFPEDTDSRSYFDSEDSADPFALCDVDGDGREELILTYSNTSMAEMNTSIYDYDPEQDALVSEFSAFPSLVFYDNGVIQANWSHNQGRAGNFWPYTLFQYDQASDSYLPLGSVDAWDSALFPEDAEGNPFPETLDVSGTGMLYYLMDYGTYDTSDPVDEADYLAWRDSFLQGANELEIPYQDLNEENIAKIG